MAASLRALAGQPALQPAGLPELPGCFFITYGAEAEVAGRREEEEEVGGAVEA